jgi:hypothetical protein
VKKTELIELLQADIEENGDGDVVIQTQRALLHNSSYTVQQLAQADNGPNYRRFALGAVSRVY